MKASLFFLLVLFIACSGSSQQNHSNVEKNKVSTDTSITSNHKEQTYQFENDMFKQILVLNSLEENRTDFVLTVHNKKTNKHEQINGSAISSIDADPEIDEDEQGLSYPAQQYKFEKNGCTLFIRISQDAHDMIRIKSSGCNSFNLKEYPFESQGILRIKK